MTEFQEPIQVEDCLDTWRIEYLDGSTLDVEAYSWGRESCVSTWSYEDRSGFGSSSNGDMLVFYRRGQYNTHEAFRMVSYAQIRSLEKVGSRYVTRQV